MGDTGVPPGHIRWKTMALRSAAPGPGSVGAVPWERREEVRYLDGEDQRVKTGAPTWGKNQRSHPEEVITDSKFADHEVAAVAVPGGKNAEEQQGMGVDPEAREVSMGDLEKGRTRSADQWNLVKKLTYDISGDAVPRRISRPRRHMTSGYETGCRRDSSNEEGSRHRRSSPRRQHRCRSTSDRRGGLTAQHWSYRRGKEKTELRRSRFSRDSSPEDYEHLESRHRRRPEDEKKKMEWSPGRSTSESTDRDRMHRHHRDTSPSSSDGSSSDRRVSVTAAATHHRQKLKLRTFDGTGSFETSWVHFITRATYNGWKATDQLAHLKAALTGDECQVLWDTHPVPPTVCRD